MGVDQVQSRKWVTHVVMIVWCSTEFCRSCARALPSVTCQNALVLGRRCMSVFMTGATKVRLIEYWSVYAFA